MDKTTASRHKWTIEDDKAALNAYFAGIPKSEADKIALSRGIKPASFWCRVCNYQYLATEGRKGFANYAKQSEAVYRQSST